MLARYSSLPQPLEHTHSLQNLAGLVHVADEGDDGELLAEGHLRHGGAKLLAQVLQVGLLVLQLLGVQGQGHGHLGVHGVEEHGEGMEQRFAQAAWDQFGLGDTDNSRERAGETGDSGSSLENVCSLRQTEHGR